MGHAYKLALQYLSASFFLEIEKLVILEKECGITVKDQFSTVKWKDAWMVKFIGYHSRIYSVRINSGVKCQASSMTGHLSLLYCRQGHAHRKEVGL